MSNENHSYTSNINSGGIETTREIDAKGVKSRTIKFKNGTVVKQVRAKQNGSLRYPTIYYKTEKGGVKTEKFRDEKGRFVKQKTTFSNGKTFTKEYKAYEKKISREIRKRISARERSSTSGVSKSDKLERVSGLFKNIFSGLFKGTKGIWGVLLFILKINFLPLILIVTCVSFLFKILFCNRVGWCVIGCLGFALMVWWVSALDYIDYGIYNGGYVHNLFYTHKKVLEIPSEIWGKTITSVECQGLIGVETVIIPNTVEEIGDSAFQNCRDLKEIKFEEGSKLKKIGANAFGSCWSLKSIELEKCTSLEVIDDGAFYECAELERLTIPKSVHTLGSELFGGNSYYSLFSDKIYYKIEEIVFEEGSELINLEEQSFTCCNYLNSINLEKCEKLKTIKPGVFSGCLSLESIVIPLSIEYIEDFAFRGCDELKTITFSNESNLKGIGYCAFKKCSKLVNIDFRNCSNLQEIEEGAFENCVALNNLVFNSSMTIGENAFKGCTGLQNFEFKGGVDKSLFKSGCFSDCAQLKNVKINAKCELASGVFKNCVDLRTIDFGYSVAKVFKGEFADKTLLDKITFSNNFSFHNGYLDEGEECQLQSSTEICFLGTQEQWDYKRVLLQIPYNVRVIIYGEDA